jgi:dTDP-4-amino-4,6-dideoxygalactose transaminase
VAPAPVQAGGLPEIPFNRPTLTGREQEYLERALASARLSGDGEFTHRCQRLLEETLGVPKVLLTTSCTHALEMSALLLDLEAGDEVVLPSFTFVSTANAFVLRGARPVFADVLPDTLNLDPASLAERISPRTRAVVPIHYAGIGAAMEAILAIARGQGLAVVEDNAHGLFGRLGTRALGSLGDLATLSFHDTKNFTCGEGGALLINDPALVQRAEILREKGTDRSRFFRGEVDKYTWVDMGSSYLPSELLAAMLLAQLEARETIQQRRRALWLAYRDGLADWAARHAVRLPHVPPEAEPAYHLFFLVLPTPAARQGLLAHLRARNIRATFHYVPLHLSAMGQRFGGRAGEHPVTEAVSETLVRLPFFTSMRTEEQARVLEAVQDFTP